MFMYNIEEVSNLHYLFAAWPAYGASRNYKNVSTYILLLYYYEGVLWEQANYLQLRAECAVYYVQG